ncbi:glycoside hydrolase family 16 protein [Thermothelomyces thermophilus ATCC 42464]|uniref:Crh-like protein n=1 Tax=Thermothelomyces thermophilus (strain ATCC 42464 / BCRC 31852 / DSM 1799) TaxID=573729 RepID=G2QHP5_THET4|nr:glycoside hydrolase family 16 protein [Thermothelomyces thermophilus ATCC 42464]AEO58905.1 glycoside hydrolase family 16 protein [Thermothelomyces thermophilus ATCC 42464]
MLSKVFATVALAASLVSAQTFTDCDPTKRDDCPNPKAVGSKPVDIDFRQGPNSFFKLADGTSLKYDKDLGAVFSISKETDAPTISSNKYIFFGQVDVTVRAARGTGVVTSFVLQSDDLDEIDWEWLGGDATQVQTNYFSKGCTETYDRGGFSPVADPINQFHTYTIKWTPEQLDWIIDGNVVRTLKNTGVEGCSGYPQSPMQIKLGTWVAGRKDAPQGTIDWAGGLTDFSQAPFDGYYQSLHIVDYMGGRGAKEATEYHYTDRSGKWESIEVINDGKGSDDDTTTSSKTSATSTKATSTSKPSSSSSPSSSHIGHTLTTLTTVSSSATRSASSTDGAASTSGPTSTSGNEVDPTSTASQTVSTGAAPSMAGNLAAVGAAALFGYLAL